LGHSEKMRFLNTSLNGVSLVTLEPKSDDRGFFSRAFCVDEFKAQGILFNVTQCNLTSSARKGTLRGLHYEYAPATEQKIVRCTQGSVYYVIVDMRVDSSTYLRHCAFELSSTNYQMLYVSPGFLSGSQALTDGAEVAYMLTERYRPEREGGFRYDDPAFGIAWPLEITALSEKDAGWPPFETTGRQL
jgi:dTDP-4-dehydrorhamnose 3,5-epimerase